MTVMKNNVMVIVSNYNPGYVVILGHILPFRGNAAVISIIDLNVSRSVHRLISYMSPSKDDTLHPTTFFL